MSVKEKDGRKEGRGSEYARRFEQLREMFLRSDGVVWKNAEIERSTKNRVSAGYLTALAKGRNHSPGFEPLSDIAAVMGFPVEYWRLSLDLAGVRAPAKEAQEEHRAGGTRAVGADVGDERTKWLIDLAVRIGRAQMALEYERSDSAAYEERRRLAEDLQNAMTLATHR